MTYDIRFTGEAAKHIPPTARVAMTVHTARVGDELVMEGYAPDGYLFQVVDVQHTSKIALVDLVHVDSPSDHAP